MHIRDTQYTKMMKNVMLMSLETAVATGIGDGITSRSNESKAILIRTTDESLDQTVESLTGTWDMDESHIANEMGYKTRMALVTTIIIGWAMGVFFGTLVVRHALAEGIFR